MPDKAGAGRIGVCDFRLRVWGLGLYPIRLKHTANAGKNFCRYKSFMNSTAATTKTSFRIAMMSPQNQYLGCV